MTWRPETPQEAIAAALHRDGCEHCQPPWCCTIWGSDFAQAERVVETLEAINWLPPRPAVSLPQSAPKGREGELVLTDFTERVLGLLRHGSVDTWELNVRYESYSTQRPDLFPKRAFDTPRKRLSELEVAGYVRQVTDGEKQLLRQHHGISYGVWELTDKGRAAVAPEAVAA